MFKRIISRDNGNPWPETQMSSATWQQIDPQWIRISELIATQDGVYLHALTRLHVTLFGDQYPHIIFWQDEYYLEDGHHRVVREAIEGSEYVMARVLVLADS